MVNEAQVLKAQFARTVNGYATTAVDEFVQQLGQRLDETKTRLDVESKRAADLEAELTKARETLSTFAQKEAAIASSFVAIETHRATVENELKERWAAATAEAKAKSEEARTQATTIIAEAEEHAKRVIDDASATSTTLLAEAQRNADDITVNAQIACAAEEERLQALQTSYEDTLDRVRRALQGQLSSLPPSQLTIVQQTSGPLNTREYGVVGSAVTSAAVTQSNLVPAA
jgi:cell division septum initiation protein DivIVA